jgi:hypothetical protein
LVLDILQFVRKKKDLLSVCGLAEEVRTGVMARNDRLAGPGVKVSDYPEPDVAVGNQATSKTTHLR